MTKILKYIALTMAALGALSGIAYLAFSVQAPVWTMIPIGALLGVAFCLGLIAIFEEII